jgi:hypothetical protein
MLVTEITTHVPDALDRLLQQYKRPLMEGLITVFAQQAQKLENALYPLGTLCQIANAYGAQLDGLGQLLDLPRNGLDDQTYILFLYGKIAEDFSDTTIRAITNVINYVFQAQVVIMQEIYPAGISVQVAGTPLTESLFPLAVSLVQAAMGAGIQLVFIGGSATVDIFRFDGPGVIGTENGFGDLNDASVGGGFVSIL